MSESQSDPPQGGSFHTWAPGAWVRHPGRRDWGRGQVQSAVGNRVTVNFENAGKQLINVDQVSLAEDDDD